MRTDYTNVANKSLYYPYDPPTESTYDIYLDTPPGGKLSEQTNIAA